MIAQGPYTLVAGVPQSISVNDAPSVAAVVVENDSPFTLTVNFGGAMLYPVRPYIMERIDVANYMGWTGLLDFTPVASTTFVNQPVQEVVFKLYKSGESIPGTYPVALGRIANVGNAVPLVSSADSIQNTGNAPGTKIITAQDTASPGINSSMDNSGAMNMVPESIGQYASVFAIQKGDASNPAKVNMGGATYTGGKPEVHIQTEHNGGIIDVIQTVPGGAGAATLIIGGNSAVALRLKNMAYFTGAGNGTFTHGLGVTPDLVLIMPIGVTPTSVATTNYTATQVDVAVQGGIANWRGVAIKFG